MRLMLPGGARKIIAENMAVRQSHESELPNKAFTNALFFGFLTALISPKRLSRIATAIKPATLLKFYRALIKRKYQLMFTNKTIRRPGPKGPSQELIDAIFEMKRCNPRFGCRRLVMQISNALGCEIDKDVVRRVLSKYFKISPTGGGPSWLTFIGHMKESLPVSHPFVELLIGSIRRAYPDQTLFWNTADLQ